MKKIYALSALGVFMLTMTGCIGTKQISKNILDDGTVAAKDIRFPKLDDAWQKQGHFSSYETLRKIRAGVTKDDLYQLIGYPDFNEGSQSREWDYILKFQQDDDSVKVCQYKVIFDKDYRGQGFYWLPQECAAYAKPPTMPAPVIINDHKSPAIHERINLEADALFEFNKYKTEDMLPAGRIKLDELANQLIEWENRGDSQVRLVGHTDRLGGHEYNMKLSERRAETVRLYLISRGVNAKTLSAKGAGELEPVHQCSNALPRPKLIECLQPNRRVEVNVTVYESTNQNDDQTNDIQ